ncbi:hypothetical protein V491_00035 [Pseudogymnoascus sp. VKM F-3775]|nr:hypothetical protein V491_00035 [Pseudogymnoascus sp. VKM F-3775]
MYDSNRMLYDIPVSSRTCSCQLTSSLLLMVSGEQQNSVLADRSSEAVPFKGSLLNPPTNPTFSTIIRRSRLINSVLSEATTTAQPAGSNQRASVQPYVVEFKQLSTQLPDPTAAAQFVRGLKSHIREALIVKKTMTLTLTPRKPSAESQTKNMDRESTKAAQERISNEHEIGQHQCGDWCLYTTLRRSRKSVPWCPTSTEHVTGNTSPSDYPNWEWHHLV